MKWLRFLSAVVATLGLTTVAQAGLHGLFDGFHGHQGSSKCCGCEPCCQPVCCKPVCCKPTITRPCDIKVHTYQRKCSDLKPPCCNTCCAPKTCCAPAPKCCAPAPKCCAPAPCCEPSCCGSGGHSCLLDIFKGGSKGCGSGGCGGGRGLLSIFKGRGNGCGSCGGGSCGGGCGSGSCGSGSCGSGSCGSGSCGSGCGGGGCGGGGLLSGHGLFGKGHGLFFQGKSKGVCYETTCTTTKVCCADPCEIAELIYRSQTACYAKDRERAIDNLGDYDCQCNPEILTAMIYALNDADEEVRAEAADEIGDVLRKNTCCCSKEIVDALTCALSDCDRDVRRQAEQALEVCGYCIVDGCCCSTCGGGPGGDAGLAPAPAPADDGAAPAPAPPEEPKAYFPSRLRQQQSARPVRRNGRLADLFGLLD